MKTFLALVLLATPLAALEYWVLGAFGGFRLSEKLPPKLKRILKVWGWVALLSGVGAAGIASMHGCSLRAPQLAPRMVDTSSQWRPLPPLIYHVEPDAKSIAPTPAVPPVAENTEVWTTASSSSFIVTGPTGVVTLNGVQHIEGFGSASTAVTIVVPMTGTVTVAGAAAYSRMAKMKSYPASHRPSECVASCLSHHRSWVTPVENSYCEQDTSNADGGFYGWVKERDVWIPTMWPATQDSDERAPKLIRLKDGEQVSLTEGKRSY